MNPMRVDALSRLLAERRLSRRQAMQQGAGALAAGTFATSGLAHAAAQEATPAPFPSDPHPGADTTGTHPEFLFTQPFDAGAWEPKPGESGTYLLTLTGAAASTTYFSDRPERITGLAPTQMFLDALGFSPQDPPNAALVTQTEAGVQDVLVIELLNPVYDAAAGTLAYDARVLADYGERGLAYLAQQQTDYELAATFGAGSLFIDDCPNSTDYCYTYSGGPGNCTSSSQALTYVGAVTSGNCYQVWPPGCPPCGDYSRLCNQAYPSACQGNCFDDIAMCGIPGGCCNGDPCDFCQTTPMNG